MKKFLILSIFFGILPSFAMCPIDSENAVCALPGFREQVNPIYIQSPSATPYPNASLQPLKRQDPIEQMRGPNNDRNYNSGCQFGVCLQNPTKSTIPNNR